jgi:hypothetical protein
MIIDEELIEEVQNVNWRLIILFVEIKFHGRSVLVGLVCDPPKVEGLPIYLLILEDLVPRYAHSIFLGDLNTDLFVNTGRAHHLTGS